MDDGELLRDYVERGSHEAFTELVRRRIGLVYSSALRQMGEAHAAEDVTQAAFIALARNARRINRGEVLSAWLLAVTRHIAANTRRSEARRKRREWQTAQLAQAANMHEDDGEWQQIAPHLDEAIAELREPSRKAVVLRYFEELSPDEVAARLGITPEAARQRISRGLEQLRSIFAQKGISVTSIGVAGLIASHGIHEAPAGLATTTAAAAVGAGASAGGILAKGVAALMTATQAKVAVAAAILLMLGIMGAALVVFLPQEPAATVVDAERPLDTLTMPPQHTAETLAPDTSVPWISLSQPAPPPT